MMFDFAAESGLYRVKSPLNYVGGKFDLLGQLLAPHTYKNKTRKALVPNNIETFVDICCGGFNVGVNMPAKNVIAVDLDKDVISLLTWMRDTPSYEAITTIEKIVRENGLGKPRNPKIQTAKSNTTINTNNDENFEDIPEESEESIKSPEEIAYYTLRKRHNTARLTGESTLDGNDLRAVLYTLICHGFNSHIRFGPNGYNIPFGHRTFNNAMNRNFSEFSDRLRKEQPKLIHADFDYVESLNLGPNDFVYVDPPYLITTAPYNESGQGWNVEDEINLYNMLDNLDKRGVRFGVSNVIEHKGIGNPYIGAMAQKYVLHDLDYHYNSASHNLKMTKEERKDFPTREVFLTNVRG